MTKAQETAILLSIGGHFLKKHRQEIEALCDGLSRVPTFDEIIRAIREPNR